MRGLSFKAFFFHHMQRLLAGMLIVEAASKGKNYLLVACFNI
jgi:hypothetical protein